MASAQNSNLNPDPNSFVPPHSIEMEEAVLGGIMLDPGAMDRVVGILNQDDFYISAHSVIYKACWELHQDSKPLDLLSVMGWLADRNLLDNVGGRAKLVALASSTVSAINVDVFAQNIVEKAISRQMIVVGNEIASLARDPEDLDKRLDLAEQKVFALRRRRAARAATEHISDPTSRTFNQIEEVLNNGMQPTIPTGFYDLDTLLGGGFYPGDLIVLGARPSMGKTALSCAIAYQIAVIHSSPVLIFSLEMSSESIANRYISSIAGIESDKIRQGQIAPSQLNALASAVNTLTSSPVLINDNGNISVFEIRSEVRKAISQYGQLKLVVIDYLQLMVDSSDMRLTERIGEVTRQLKLLAKECGVPIMLLSQLNRGVEDRTNKRPLQSDLRSSGRIEEDADVILFPYRDEYYHQDTMDKGVMEIGCTKNRNGATGTIKVLFEPQYSRVKNLKR